MRRAMLSNGQRAVAAFDPIGVTILARQADFPERSRWADSFPAPDRLDSEVIESWLRLRFVPVSRGVAVASKAPKGRR